MKYLKITQSTDPRNPHDGNPYVYFNRDIDTVWMFLGIKWILSNGKWNTKKSWSNTGRWNSYGPVVGGGE